MEAVLVLGLVALVSAATFYLGYDTARKKNKKFENAIRASYQTLLNEQRQMANSPSALAQKKGFSEGYQQGIEDSHQAIDKMLGQP